MKAYRYLLPLIGVGLLVTLWSPALAHAELRRSDPSAGATVDRAPMEVFVWFSSPLSVGSKLSVFDDQFQAVDKGETFIDASDTTLLRIQLGPLAPGRYTVNWKANAIDGHVSSGSYDFFVRQDSGLIPLIIGVVGGLLILVIAFVLIARARARRQNMP